jgi:hypothetical protein
MPTNTTETIEQRIARGLAQNSTADGAIVPFPKDTEFDNLASILPGRSGTKIAGLQNAGYVLTKTYIYHYAAGVPILGVLRLDHATEKKQFLPLRCEKIVGRHADASVRHIEGRRPLYNLHLLAARPDAPILFTEGEKAAEAAGRAFPEFVSTTWPGGSGSVGTADLSPVAGRDITIWPDHDAAGLKAAKALAAGCLAAGARSCRVVQIPDHFPSKWDLADAEELQNV